MTAEVKIRTLAQQSTDLQVYFGQSPSGPFRWGISGMTCPALATTVILSDVGVFLGVLVAMLAMRLCFAFGGNCCGSGPRPQPTPKVFFPGYSFEVIGVDAASDTTEVVEVQACRHRSKRALIGNSMGQGHLFSHSGPDLAVSIVSGRPCPEPASRIWLGRNKPFDSHVNRLSLGHGAIVAGGGQ